jgi:hypothetical protein
MPLRPGVRSSGFSLHGFHNENCTRNNIPVIVYELNSSNQRSEVELISFEEQIERVLGISPREGPMPNEGKLFPPDDPPSAVIYFGRADQAAVVAVRGQLPAACILLWLCPPETTQEAVDFLCDAALSSGERTLVTVADSNGSYEKKIELLLVSLEERTVRFIVEGGFRERYPTCCERISQCIRRTLENFSMDAGRGLIFLRASLMNLPSMVHEVTPQLPQVTPETVAVIVGAGPSLRKQIEELRQAASHCLLIAVGHAVPTLLEHGITPDVVVENDPRSGVDNWPETINTEAMKLVATTTLDPTLSERFSGVVWCCGSSPAMNALAPKLGIALHNMTIYKTVSTHALDVAVRLGCRTIALIGQEYCLSAGTRSHADGKHIPLSERILNVPSAAGGWVETTIDLETLRQAMTEYIQLISKAFRTAIPPLQLVNCTKGGAQIPGVPRKELHQIAADGVTPILNWITVKQPEAANKTVTFCERWYQESVEDPADCIQPFLKNMVSRLVRQYRRAHAPCPDEKADALAHRFLEDARRLIRDDLLDVKRRICDAQTRPSRDTHLFECFPAWNLAMLDLDQGAIDTFLRSPDPLKETPVPYRFRWKNQQLPWVAIRDEMTQPPTWHAPTGLWSMMQDAREDNEAYDDKTGFNPDQDILVVVAPGNYAHLIERALRNRITRLIVVEPWPAALREMMRHGVFLHFLPRDTRLIGIDKTLPDWNTLLRRYSLRWSENGHRKTHVFVPPRLLAVKRVRDVVQAVHEQLSIPRSD